MTKRSKRWLLAALAVLFVAAVAGAVTSKKQSGVEPDKPAAPPLEFAASELVSLESRPLSTELDLPGSVLAVNQATVRAKLSAEVRRVAVREGERVAAGQVLAEFDTTQLRAQLAERQASWEAAKALLANSQRAKVANAALVKQNFISQNAADNADSAYQSQLAAVAAARAALEQTQIQMNDAQVRAPIAGVVAKRHVQSGEKVSFDSPLIGIVDLSALEVQAQAPVSDVPLLAPGMPVEVAIEGLADKRFAARIERINPATEPGTRMLNVYLSLPNPDGVLRAGMFARVKVALASETPRPSLPLSALRGDATQSYVWVIADGKLARRNVEVGRRDERAQRVEVRTALAAAEPILAGKFDNLREGLAAKPAAPAPAAATSAK